MARRIEPVCATCEMLHYAYKQHDGTICHECMKEPHFIPASAVWNETCPLWAGRVKQGGN